MFVMYTRSRVTPSSSSITWSSNLPDRPTNGSPCSSSSLPGASPTIISGACGSPNDRRRPGCASRPGRISCRSAACAAISARVAMSQHRQCEADARCGSLPRPRAPPGTHAFDVRLDLTRGDRRPTRRRRSGCARDPRRGRCRGGRTGPSGGTPSCRSVALVAITPIVVFSNGASGAAHGAAAPEPGHASDPRRSRRRARSRPRRRRVVSRFRPRRVVPLRGRRSCRSSHPYRRRLALSRTRRRSRRRTPRTPRRRRDALGVAHGEIEDDGADHDGHRATRTGLVAEPVLLAPPHRPVAGGKPKGRAAAEHDDVNVFDETAGREQLELAGARRAAAHFARRDRTRRQHHRRAAGQRGRGRSSGRPVFL